MGKTLKNLEHLLRKTAVTVLTMPLMMLPSCHKPEEPEPDKDTISPIINIESPVKNQEYDSNTISFEWNIIEPHFSSAEYSLDNETAKVPIGKSGKKDLELPNGDHTLKVYAKDESDNKSQKELPFYVDKISKKVVNPFVHPNDSTLKWYGSADVDGNNEVNWNDYSAMSTTSNDQSDIDGDGTPSTENDKKILSDKLSGLRLYLPGYWNELQTRAERVDWVLKMYAIDKTNLSGGTPEYDCTKFTYQANINIKGYGNQEDISNILKFYPLDFSNNGRFNLPVYELQLVHYNSEGKPTDGHDMNAIFVEDSAPNYSNLIRIEPQNDAQDPPLGEGYLAPFATNSKLFICGSPIIGGPRNTISSKTYITYKVENGNVTLESVNPDIDLITQRGK